MHDGCVGGLESPCQDLGFGFWCDDLMSDFCVLCRVYLVSFFLLLLFNVGAGTDRHGQGGHCESPTLYVIAPESEQ